MSSETVENTRGPLDMSWVEELRAWRRFSGSPEKQYTFFMILLLPDGSNVSTLPGWSEDEPVDEQVLRAEMYKMVDYVLDKRYSKPE